MESTQQHINKFREERIAKEKARIEKVYLFFKLIIITLHFKHCFVVKLCSLCKFI